VYLVYYDLNSLLSTIYTLQRLLLTKYHILHKETGDDKQKVILRPRRIGHTKSVELKSLKKG